MKTNIRFIALFLLLFLIASCDQFPTEGNDYGFEANRIPEPITIVPSGEFETYYNSMPKDSVTVLDAKIINSIFFPILKILIQYKGGCRQHTFELLASWKIYATLPPQIPVYLGHNAFNDPCSTMIHDVIYFDLEPLREKLEKSGYGSSGEIIIRLNNEDNHDESKMSLNL